MIDPFQLKKHGITNNAVLDAFKKVNRAKFVDIKNYHLANIDSPLPIGYGQTISQPTLVAFMTQLLDIHPHHSILEIGTGSGFQTAILTEISQNVTTIECVPELLENAKNRLTGLGYRTITFVLDDGYLGYPDKGPYDRIMVTAAAPEIPDSLVEQLSETGKLLIPIGEKDEVQYLYSLHKNDNGSISKTKHIPVRFVPLINTARNDARMLK